MYIMINNGRIRMDILVHHLFMLKNSACASVYCILSYLIYLPADPVSGDRKT